MKTSNRLTPLLVGATLLIAGGCGQLAYKTGAGADALQADGQACRQAGGDPASYDRCMHDKGWALTDLGGSDEAQPAAPATTPAAASVTAPGPASISTPATTPTPAVAAASVPDPTAPVKVTAWVHLGGGGPDDDIAACVATLGPMNQPDIAHHIVTRALLACMRGKGWHGV